MLGTGHFEGVSRFCDPVVCIQSRCGSHGKMMGLWLNGFRDCGKLQFVKVVGGYRRTTRPIN